MKIGIYITLLFLVLSIISCEKETATFATSASINFVYPAVNDTISLGEEIHAEGTIQATEMLNGYSLKMVDQTTNEVLYSAATSVKKSAYVFHEHWVNNLTDTTHVRVTVEVNLNDNGAKTSKDVMVVIIP
jgi:hypothetical protein